jgi:hypothetical protein
VNGLSGLFKWGKRRKKLFQLSKLSKKEAERKYFLCLVFNLMSCENKNRILLPQVEGVN